MAKKKVEVHLYYNYPTDAFVRFDEEVENKKKIGSLYIRKGTYEELGEPEYLKITIEEDDKK